MSGTIESGRMFDFCSPVRLHFGEGLLDNLERFCGESRRILLVTGRNSARKNGLIDRVRKSLGGRIAGVFSEADENPSIETVENCAKVAVEIRADMVIGLGGGSAMDTAKVVAVLASNRGGFRDLQGKQAFENCPVPTIMIPTTCGTGSEANRYAIIADDEKQDKVNFANRQTYPAVSVLDPSVLEGIPPDILVWTALDAFSHAFEGYTSRRSQPFADTLAFEAMSIIIHHLPSAAEGNRESKANLLYAASLAGIVIDHTGTTMLHAMGYYLTLRHGIPHGKANAILLPVLFAHLERAGLKKLASVYKLFPEGKGSYQGLKRYLRDLNVDTSLSAHGVDASELEPFSRYVLGRKNTAATVGNIDNDVLRWLFERHV